MEDPILVKGSSLVKGFNTGQRVQYWSKGSIMVKGFSNGQGPEYGPQRRIMVILLGAGQRVEKRFEKAVPARVLVKYWSNPGSKEVEPHALSPGGGPRCWSVNSQILVKYWSKRRVEPHANMYIYIYPIIYIYI